MPTCNALTLRQLLSLRDGEPVDANLLLHIDHCPKCSEELGRLRALQASMRALPSAEPPAYDGKMLRSRLRGERLYRAAGVSVVAGIGALTLLLIAAVHGNRTQVETAENRDDSPSMTAVEDVAEPSVSSWVIRSQELESRLSQLPRRPRIERASTSATIDTLQSRIQWVDYQLSVAKDVGMTERQSAQLWRNRVELMDSLVMVRYAEAQHAVLLPIASAGSSQ
jgi:hypothetical protein